MPGVPARCDNCGYEFEGRAIFLQASVNTTVLPGSKESCPRCGAMASVVAGTFNVHDDLFEAVSVAAKDRELLQRLSLIAEQAQEGTISEEDAASQIAAESPDIASLLERVPPRLQTAVIWILLTLLSTLASQGLAEFRDDSATPDDVEQVVERTLEQHDSAEQDTLRRVVEEAVETYYHEHPRSQAHRRDEGVIRQKTSRNDPCPCGSEQKYKKCCGQ